MGFAGLHERSSGLIRKYPSMAFIGRCLTVLLGVMAQVFEIGSGDCASLKSESFGTRQALS